MRRLVGRFVRGMRSFTTALRRSRDFASPARYVACFLLTRFRLNERVVFEYQGARFRLWHNSVSCYMYFHNSERWICTADILLMKRLLRPGDVMVDIGANVGSHCITLAKYLGETSRVYAFEPHPNTFRLLQENMRLNSLNNLEIYNYALGETDGEVFFTNKRQDDINRVVLETDTDEELLKVPMRRLDSFEFAHSPITLIKIDAEGYELYIFRGAEIALSNAQFLHLEAYEPNFQQFGYSLHDIVDFLDARGWRLYRVVDNQHLQRIDRCAVPSEDHLCNWLGAKSESLLIERTGMKILETV